MNFTFSSDSTGVKMKDLKDSSRMSEEFFKMKTDPNQIPATPENVTWVRKNIPNCVNVIRKNGKLAGFTFLIPTTKKTMDAFIKKKITEKQLFEKTKKEFKKMTNVEAIYLCAAIIAPKHQKKGLATTGYLKSIATLKNKHVKPTIYFEAWTLEGRK